MDGVYYKVKCKCGHEQRLFSHSSLVVRCEKCNEPLAHPTGGKAVIHGEIVEELG